MIERTQPQPTDELRAFNESVLAQCKAYVDYFPAEAERIAPLIEALQNPALDLRDRKTIPEGHLCSSGIILSAREDEVLMLKHKKLGIWVVPGGHYDVTDPVISDTAIRESAEETGQTGFTLHPWHLKHGIPLDIDIHPIPDSPKRNEGPHQHFDFRYVLQTSDYDGLVNATQSSLDLNEVLGARSVPLNEIDQQMSIAPAMAKISVGTLTN